MHPTTKPPSHTLLSLGRGSSDSALCDCMSATAGHQMGTSGLLEVPTISLRGQPTGAGVLKVPSVGTRILTIREQAAKLQMQSKQQRVMMFTDLVSKLDGLVLNSETLLAQ